ncbi:MAG: PBSX family phage terminase large subunit [Clostridia bacterium]|nr:PBSX family phage terminase large subunit [Clostridia bacterium]
MRILPNKVYLPDIIGGGYGKFWKDKSRYRVLKGGKGSKKSTTTALNFICRLMQYPESNLLVIRAVMNTHRDSTFAQLKWAIERLKVAHLWQCNVSSMEMTYLPTGQKILFRGFDDVLKLASTTVPKGYLCWVWIEEAFEIESEADFDKLDLSVPRGNIPDTLFKQTTMTFNPWSAEHWLKKRFFDKPSPDISVYSTNYFCNEFLDDTDRAVFERMRQQNPQKYSVAGLGNWGIAEGLVYENWEVAEFSIDKDGVPIADGNTSSTVNGPPSPQGEGNNAWQWKHFFGLDYGYTNDPTAFTAFALNPITKQMFIYDEHYEKKMLNSDIAEMIKSKGFAKERIRADAAEPKSNDDLRRLGISHILPSVKGRDSIMNGIQKISEYHIYVHPKCVNTIKELSSYRYEVDGSSRGLNKPIDFDNHLMDAMRYAFYDVAFFHPVDPKRKLRPTAEEYYNKRYGISVDDLNGGWI